MKISTTNHAELWIHLVHQIDMLAATSNSTSNNSTGSQLSIEPEDAELANVCFFFIQPKGCKVNDKCCCS
jgi:hypothetical protein